VAFMGTKSARDLLTNGHILMGPVWPELAADAPGRAAAAHRGYLSRARSIPVEQLYAEARRRNKRLVFCGVWSTVSTLSCIPCYGIMRCCGSDIAWR
jgi:hypothetical protein